jgi:hypothetical protein
MFELTPELELKLQRLQIIVDEKRDRYLQLQNEYRQGSSIEGLTDKIAIAELELREASYQFNLFTGSLPLKKK